MVRFGCSGSDSPALVAEVRLEVAVAVVAVAAGVAVEALARVTAAETESIDVLVAVG